MSVLLLERLGNFCDQFIGESPPEKPLASKKTTEIDHKSGRNYIRPVTSIISDQQNTEKYKKKIYISKDNEENDEIISKKKKKTKKKKKDLDTNDAFEHKDKKKLKKKKLLLDVHNEKIYKNENYLNKTEHSENNKNIKRKKESIENSDSDEDNKNRFKKDNNSPTKDKKNKGNVKSPKNKLKDRSNDIKKHSEIKMTQDGFKIASGVPSDDSDVSDAFESDLDDIYDDDDVQQKSIKTTDDGFKIVSSIPDDDSDIDDAFESDEQQESVKMTNDGFKIVSSIPDDDSNIDDAFESCDESGNETDDAESGVLLMKTKISKPLKDIMSEFGLDEKRILKKVEGSPCEQPIDGKKRALLNKNVQIIDYSKKKKITKKNIKKKQESFSTKKKKEESSDKKMSNREELRKVKFDVFKFGLSGFDKETHKNARVSLAIQLGAKPPKKKAVNYKLLQEQKKEVKIKERENREENRRSGMKVAKKFKPPERKGFKGIDCQVGRYVGGVQMLSKKDIKEIEGS